MQFFLLRLWPALIPFALYFGWLYYQRYRARKLGLEPVTLSKGSLFWTLLASALLVIACFLYYGISHETGKKGQYVPAYMEDGVLIPGRVLPEGTDND